MTMPTAHLLRTYCIETVGAVSLLALTDGTYDVVTTGPDHEITTDLDDVMLAAEGEAVHAFNRACDHLTWLADTPAGRNAARDIAIEDAVARSRRAHPAGGGRS